MLSKDVSKPYLTQAKQANLLFNTIIHLCGLNKSQTKYIKLADWDKAFKLMNEINK